jgi:hypothetical protein
MFTARTGAKTSGFGALFDRADNGAIVGKRNQSTVALQALFMMNDAFVAAQANALARRIHFELPSDSDEQRIHRLYEISLGRRATDSELKVSMRMLASNNEAADAAWDRLCLIVLCTNEFIYIE